MSNFQHPGDELISTDPTKPTNYQKAMGSAKVQQLVDAVNENYSNGYSGGVGYLAFKA